MFSIEEFRSEVNKHNVLHGNRYIVMMPLAFGKDALLTDLNTEDLDKSINQISDKYEGIKTLALRAESITLPGMSFTSADGLPPRFGYGAMEGIPYNTTFDPVTIQFAMDGAGLTYKYFYEWTNKIVNYRAKGQRPRLSNDSGKLGTYEVAYKDSYCAETIEIIVYEPNHDPKKGDEYVMKIKLYRAYPKDLPPINLAWAAQNEYVKFPITFDYTDFDIEFPNSH